MIIKNFYTMLWIIWLGWVINWASKKITEPLKRVLVHRINHGKVNNCKEQNLGPECHRSECSSSPVDLLFCDDRFFHTSSNLISCDLGFCKNINKFIILKNSNNFRVFSESFQNSILDISSSFSSCSILLHNLIFFLLKVRHFCCNKLI